MDYHKKKANAIVDHVNFYEPPIDFSFLSLTSTLDALDEIPRVRGVQLKKGHTKKFISTTLLLNNNCMGDCLGLSKLIENYFLFPRFLQWINLSFNEFTNFPDELLALDQLQILYFHSNGIMEKSEIMKLQKLRNLRSLTMHGNPIEKEDNYRIEMLVILPYLRSLDFSDVTPADLFVAQCKNEAYIRIAARKKARRFK